VVNSEGSITIRRVLGEYLPAGGEVQAAS
jgi:hypothetical protein